MLFDSSAGEARAKRIEVRWAGPYRETATSMDDNESANSLRKSLSLRWKRADRAQGMHLIRHSQCRIDWKRFAGHSTDKIGRWENHRGGCWSNLDGSYFFLSTIQVLSSNGRCQCGVRIVLWSIQSSSCSFSLFRSCTSYFTKTFTDKWIESWLSGCCSVGFALLA